ncbi:iron-siderophore ABC transporter substrate-binding protein [Corynebacterium sphenisci]|uniref:iron-siderophore ABC transporter substrate-binding protein n=1 Tax=Corynebacterium sphenisci TaxID=191493 RepID=UPI0026DFF707|nr:iron-siderophore ABC transporter substrate-binding protein [Corynebacterium sphenisci]MDO5730556.1 iron-siderophore ABC transporter substrate-binding protein [Corynebacterium sphenisci]
MRIGQRFAAAGAAIVMACGLGLAGCSSDEGGGTAAGPSTATVQPEEGDFPVTIEHAFGETTVEEMPTRVVTLGETDEDAVLALGVVPVAIRPRFDSEFVEWQKPLAGDAEPVWLDDAEIDIEKVAAVQPDLIVAMWSELSDEQFDKLSQIAPTVTYQEGKGGWTQGWEDSTLMIGKALGQPAKARELVDGIADRFAEIRERHPEWQGKTVAVPTTDSGSIYAYTSGDPRGDFFTRLGFVIPPEIAAIDPDDHAPEISQENAHLLDVDLLVWRGSIDECGPDYYDLPTINMLEVSKKGRSMCVQEVFGGDPTRMATLAFSSQTVLSLPFALDAVEEPLTEIMGG